MRNALHERLSMWCANDAGPWYDDPKGVFNEPTKRAIASARARVASKGARETPGRVVAEISFGFWRYLLTGAYQAPLWVPCLHHAFPGAKRVDIEMQVAALHELRNRIAHHEAIYHRDLERDYDYLVELAEHLHSRLGWWIDSRSRVPLVLRQRLRLSSHNARLDGASVNAGVVASIATPICGWPLRSYEGGATEVVRRARSWARSWRATAAFGSGLASTGVAGAGIRCIPAKMRSAGSVAIHRLSTVMAERDKAEVRRATRGSPGRVTHMAQLLGNGRAALAIPDQGSPPRSERRSRMVRRFQASGRSAGSSSSSQCSGVATGAPGRGRGA